VSEPITIPYNLNRLGQAGDEIAFTAGDQERAALAKFAGVLGVPSFEARIGLKKLSPTRFAVSYELAANLIQACVVTLEPLEARIERTFARELHFTPNLRRDVAKDVVVGTEDDDLPEEIDSLHYDLAGPLIEEFVLAIDPYPRAAGVEFATPPDPGGKPENPFAALKTLKSSRESTK
jgi:hypothetical protein